MKAPFPWFGDAMAYAMEHVRSGVLVVDDDGRVWRTAVNVRGGWTRISPRRAENRGGNGYLRISLHVPAAKRLAIVMAHNLVWTSARGAIPDGLEVNHRNLMRQDNRPSNLELVTPSGNIRHSYENGRAKPWSLVRAAGGGRWRGRPLVGDSEIAAMRARRAGGYVLRAIAEEFGISITHAQRLCAGARP